MNKRDAEEYTQSLGQIVAGSWRQILWAETQGVPKALGLSTRDWVEQRLGGYVKMAIPERREAVKELAANGHSTRDIADVVGVGKSQVAEDLVQIRTETQQAEPQNSDINNDVVQNRTAPAEEFAERQQAELERQQRVALARNLADVNLLRAELASDAHIEVVAELLRDFADLFEHETRMSPRVFLQALLDASTKVEIIRKKVGIP